MGELDNSYRIVFMPQGLGDILFFLMYARQYRDIIKEDKIAVVVTKRHFMQLVELFADEIDALCFMDSADEPIWRDRLTYFYDGIYNSAPQPYLLRAIQNAMGLQDTARAYIPQLPIVPSLEKMMLQYNLNEGNAIVISPDAVSCHINISDDAWIRIADLCSQKGYKVLFNVDNAKRFGEYTTVFLSIIETLQLIEKGGHFIGLRSGLCDVMAAFTNVNSLIIYPNNKKRGEYPSILGYSCDPNGAYLRYCSLKNIFPQKQITEVIYDDENALFEIILKEVKKWREY